MLGFVTPPDVSRNRMQPLLVILPLREMLR
jgi:hypothetical protein